MTESCLPPAHADCVRRILSRTCPFSVDLLERCDASAEFLSRIENEGKVDLKLPSVEGDAAVTHSPPGVGADPCA